MKEFSVSAILSKSVAVVKQSAWPLMRLFLVQVLVPLGLLFVLRLPSWGTVADYAILAALMIFVYVLRTVYVRGLLCIIDHKDVGVLHLLKTLNVRMSLRMLVAEVWYVMIGIIGLRFFIVPGILWYLSYGLYPFCLVDKETDVFDAFSCSGTLTKGRLGTLFYLGLLVFLVYAITYARIMSPVRVFLVSRIMSLVGYLGVGDLEWLRFGYLTSFIPWMIVAPFVMVPWAVAYRMLQPRTRDSVSCDV